MSTSLKKQIRTTDRTIRRNRRIVRESQHDINQQIQQIENDYWFLFPIVGLVLGWSLAKKAFWPKLAWFLGRSQLIDWIKRAINQHFTHL